MKIKINKDALENEIKIIVEKINAVQEKNSNLKNAIGNASDSFEGASADVFVGNIANMIIRTQVDIETVKLMCDLLLGYCDSMIEADNQLKQHFEMMVN
ncbi:hypothetical protein PWEIH_07671 [Listeria weihenstephanensis FSL R9-0317]|uniref:Uncharacterized protein n=1 Tax=Listeria weihenstephanensis TaxID=1006155 RepID=A0A1S7FVU9_9LIST|nr:hypothetical protein [Listeria weihenstephanensis]AQY51530.1 hypothetical protein UE46_11120 [Listeria weihenstephanensis]EUJ39283.1 hypothetical protein PWEIH_07671 [Listeria weihenstephanensis FSL R9-0317]